MVRPSSQQLTAHELSIMQILWESSPLSVAEILKAISKSPKPAYTSLLTAVKAMEAKGYISHQPRGKAHVFSPVLKRDEYQTKTVAGVVDDLFGGSSLDLAIHLVKEQELSKDHVQQLRTMLEDLS